MRFTLIPLALLSLTTPIFAAVNISFDAASDLNDNFSPIVLSGTAAPMSYSSTAGIGNSGGVLITQVGAAGSSAFVFDNSIAGSTSNIDLTFLWKSTQGSPNIRMGIVSTDSFVLNTSSRPIISGTTYYPAFYGSVGTSTVTITEQDGSFTTLSNQQSLGLTSDTWYQSTFNAAYNSSDDNYDLTMDIWTVNQTTGATLAQQASISANDVSSALSSDGSVYAFFSVNQNTGGAIDNFSSTALVPEKSFAGIILGSAALLASIGSRRKK